MAQAPVWRALTRRERAVLDRLLSRHFPGRDELAAQLDAALVSPIDREGSLAFQVSGPIAMVQRRVPVEAWYSDGAPGIRVEILLHVVDGQIRELEVYKVDGSDLIVGPFEIEPEHIETCAERRQP